MTLQILIAQYKEPEALIKPMLDSIAMQQGVCFADIEAIIANDGSDVILTDDFYKDYNFQCEYLRLEHGGISATRNALLRHATADYVMLCDADDMFTDAFALRYIFQTAKSHPEYEVISLNFYEEIVDAGGIRHYREHPHDMFCIHGKVFKRSWLAENNIQYAETQWCFGDTFFVGLAVRIANHKSYCDKPIYLWKYNPGSISRNNHYFIRKFSMKLKSDELLIDELLRRNRANVAKDALLYMLYESYYMMTQESWLKYQDIESRESSESLIKCLLVKYKQLMGRCTKADHSKVLAIVAVNYIRSMLPLPNKSYEQWISHIMSIKK